MKCVECGQWSDAPKPHRGTCKAQYLPAPVEVQAQAARAEIPDLQRFLEGAAKAGQRVERFPGGFAIVGAPPIWQERCGAGPPTFRAGSEVYGNFPQVPRGAAVYREHDPIPRDNRRVVIGNVPTPVSESSSEVEWSVHLAACSTCRSAHDGGAQAFCSAGSIYRNRAREDRYGHVQSTHRVCWRTPTGEVGRGNLVSEATARAWADGCNRRYPNMPHWVEQVRWCVVTEDAMGAKFLGNPYDRREQAESAAVHLQGQYTGLIYSVAPVDEGDAPPAWQVLDEGGKLLMQGWGAPPTEVHGLTAGCSLRTLPPGGWGLPPLRGKEVACYDVSKVRISVAGHEISPEHYHRTKIEFGLDRPFRMQESGVEALCKDAASLGAGEPFPGHWSLPIGVRRPGDE